MPTHPVQSRATKPHTNDFCRNIRKLSFTPSDPPTHTPSTISALSVRYVPSGLGPSECKAAPANTAAYQGHTKACKPILCPLPTPLGAGVVSNCPAGGAVGITCKMSCAARYTPTGVPDSLCTLLPGGMTAKYQGHTLTCAPEATCPIPVLLGTTYVSSASNTAYYPKGVKTDCTDKVALGTKCRMSCEAGYKVKVKDDGTTPTGASDSECRTNKDADGNMAPSTYQGHGLECVPQCDGLCIFGWVALAIFLLLLCCLLWLCCFCCWRRRRADPTWLPWGAAVAAGGGGMMVKQMQMVDMTPEITIVQGTVATIALTCALGEIDDYVVSKPVVNPLLGVVVVSKKQKEQHVLLYTPPADFIGRVIISYTATHDDNGRRCRGTDDGDGLRKRVMVIVVPIRGSYDHTSIHVDQHIESKGASMVVHNPLPSSAMMSSTTANHSEVTLELNQLR